MGSLDSLLEVQEIDTKLDQLRHRHATLPERQTVVAARQTLQQAERAVIADAPNHGEVPQLEGGWLDENTTHVTLSIGGNDVGFDVLMGCFLAATECSDPDFHLTIDGTPEQEPLSEALPAKIFAVQARIEEVLLRVRQQAPNAEVALVGYPQLIATASADNQYGSPVCYPDLITQSEAQFFSEMVDLMNFVMEAAAAQQRALLVDPQERFAGHAACRTFDDDEWINELINWSGSGSGFSIRGSGSFHPKQAGANAYSDLVMEAFPVPPPTGGGGK